MIRYLLIFTFKLAGNVPQCNVELIWQCSLYCVLLCMKTRQRAAEMSSTLDFLTALDRGKSFKDHLKNNFDFSQFKVIVYILYL